MAWSAFAPLLGTIGPGDSWVAGSKFNHADHERLRQNFALLFGVHLVGAGSPEGAVVGYIGDIYRRTNGSTNGTSLYVKESGNGTNNGWRPIGQALPLVDAGNSGTALTIDWSLGPVQLVTLTGNCTFTFSNPISGAEYELILLQDATGSRTVTWPASVKWPAGTAPTLTTTASKIDRAFFRYIATGTRYLAHSELNYA